MIKIIINTEELKKLIESDEKYTGYDIEKKVGISRSLISRLRMGKRDLEGLSISTAIKLQTYYNKYA